MEVLGFIFLAIITIISPVIALPLNIIAFFAFKKHKKFIAILLATSLACIAYIWKPDSHMDLYRWHLNMKYFSKANISALIGYIKLNFEPLNYTIKFIIAKNGNYNLLQFFVSMIGYYLIFWMLSDYHKVKDISNFSFFVVTTFILMSLKYIDFISGLWFNFAIIIFALGVYLNYIKQTRYMHWLFYIIPILIHTSSIYLLIILVITKILKLKDYKKIGIITFLAAFCIGPVLTFVNNNVNISIVKFIYEMYINYFLDGQKYSSLHGGTNLVLALFRLGVCIIILLSNKKLLDNYDNRYKVFIVMCITSVIAILFDAQVYIRFVFFIQLISAPILLEYFSGKYSNKKTIVLFVVLILIMFLVYRQYEQIQTSNIIPCIKNNIINDIFNLKNGTL